jgi:transposase InsO family protein
MSSSQRAALSSAMRAQDVTETLDLAFTAPGLRQRQGAPQAMPLQRQRSRYIAEELAQYIKVCDMDHVRGAPMHPQNQGNVERWHQTLKNRVLLKNYFLPGDLASHTEVFIEHHNHERYHENLNNMTPADTYFGKAPAIIKQRETIKRQTIEHRRLQHRKLAA